MTAASRAYGHSGVTGDHSQDPAVSECISSCLNISQNSGEATITNQPNEFFTPLTFGQTYRRAFAIFGRHWKTFLCLIVSLLLPLIVILITAGVLSGGVNAETGEMAHFGVFAGALFIEFLLYTLFVLLAKASMMQLVAESYIVAEQAPSGWVFMKKTFSRLPTLLCYGLIAVVIVFCSVILPAALFYLSSTKQSTTWFILAIVVSMVCAAWLIYFSVSVVCTMPAIVVEHQLSALNAMKKAWSLSMGHFCYVFGVMFVVFACSIVITAVFGPFGHIISILLVPLFAILSTIVYLNLRVCKENLTHEKLAKDLGLELQVEFPVGVGHKDETELVENPDGEII